jgi:adenylate cyclase
VHASVHWGTAVVREGDYFGASVNLAARLLNAADRDELVATRQVLEASEGAGYVWEPAGTQRVKGVTDPVELFRLA